MTITIRIDSENEQHMRLTIFQDGGNCGQLCMQTKEAHMFIDALEEYRGWICETYVA